MPKMFFGTRDFGEVDDKGNTIIEDTIAIGGFIPIVPESLSMFINHTDKNGKEIFIGDLHKDIDGDILKVIQMDCGRYALQMLGNNYIDEFVDWDYIEIIGNQYEQTQ